MSSDEQDGKGLGLKPIQVAAGALAAVTAAVLGSFLGVAGTVAGAGLASVISTVGAALYQSSIERTKRAAKAVAARNTGALRAQRPNAAERQPTQHQIARTPPAGRPQGGTAQPSARPAGPGDLYSNRAARGGYRAVQPEDPAAARIADLATPRGEQAPQGGQLPYRGLPPRGGQLPPTQPHSRVPAAAQPPTAPVSSAATGAASVPADGEPLPETPWWKRNWKLLAGTTVAVFAVGMAIVFGIEMVKGSPLSGGNGGTTLGRVLHGDGGSNGTQNQPEQDGSDEGTAPGTQDGQDQPTETPEPTAEQPDGDQQEPTGEQQPEPGAPEGQPMPLPAGTP